MRVRALLLPLVLLFVLVAPPPARSQDRSGGTRPRVPDLGLRIGRLAAGPLDAITDVEGVLVGQATVVEGDSIRTGVTAVLPHGGDLFARPVRAAIVVGNGFGKLVGLSQVQELGEIETPILLTGTLSVFRAADALVELLLAAPGHESVRSINPVVGETNDGFLSDVRARPIRVEHVREALASASGERPGEGSVGAGTGTTALGWKGGIGTASRRVETDAGAWTVGTLVQTNFGGELVVAGVPVGRSLAREPARPPHDARGGGSIMIVLATDAPLDARSLERLAERSFAGLARTGASLSHGSGDYAIAFTVDRGRPERLDGGSLTELFVAAAESTEEAILNSLFRATTVRGHRGRTVEALPVGDVEALLRERGVLPASP
jgi:D-aminopeptidase